MSYEGWKIDLWCGEHEGFMVQRTWRKISFSDKKWQNNLIVNGHEWHSLYYRQKIWKKVFAKMLKSILNSKKKFLDFSDYNVHDIPKGIYKW